MQKTTHKRELLRHFYKNMPEVIDMLDDLTEAERRCDELSQLVSDLFDAPGGSESVESEERDKAMEALRMWDERHST